LKKNGGGWGGGNRNKNKKKEQKKKKKNGPGYRTNTASRGPTGGLRGASPRQRGGINLLLAPCESARGNTQTGFLTIRWDINGAQYTKKERRTRVHSSVADTGEPTK